MSSPAKFGSPGASKMSASSSLNAAIAAKKAAEQKAAEDKAAALASRLAANKPVDPSAKGWWETSDAGQMNDDSEQKKEVKASAGFTSQYGLTGQSGIGSSMFNIKRSPEDATPPAAPATSGLTAAVAAATETAAATAEAAVAQVAAAIETKLTVGSEAPAAAKAGAPGEDDKAHGWWSQMDSGAQNKDEESQADRKAKQGFTPQFMGSSGLVNRLVPLDASAGSPKKD